MDILYSPWREKYIRDKKNDGCVFCIQIEENQDEKNFILKRYEHCFVILNLYPYNAGHLLVVPYMHVDQLYSLSAQALHEIIEVTAKCSSILKENLNNTGTNIGLNLGQGAGGTIPHHLHMHVLPRWLSDTGFLPTLSATKQISFDLKEIYKNLRTVFDAL